MASHPDNPPKLNPLKVALRRHVARKKGRCSAALDALSGRVLDAQSAGRLTRELLLVYADCLEECGLDYGAADTRVEAASFPAEADLPSEKNSAGSVN